MVSQDRLGLSLLAVIAAALLAGSCVTVNLPGTSSSTPTISPGATAPPGTSAPLPTASSAPTATVTLPPTVAPTPTPTPRPHRTARPTDPATAPPTRSPAPTQHRTPAPTISIAGATEYGQLTVQGGVVEVQPFAVPAWSGGLVDALALGGNCRGYVGSQADVLVEFNQPGPPLAPAELLRFYFVGSGDTTLVVKFGQSSGWDDAWRCNDDSFGTLHPTVDVVNPTWGWYKVWIGSIDPNELASGTLYVTMRADNHP